MRLRSFFLASLALTFVLSCGKTPEEEKPEVKPEIKVPAESQAVFSSGITFGESTGTDKQTTTVQFTATGSWTADVAEVKGSSWLTVQPSGGNAGAVNMSVIAEHNSGENSRSAKVTIKCGTVTKTFTVTQAGNPPAVVAVSSVTLDKTSASLKAGETVTLTATVKPDNATGKTVTWSTSDESVAAVENGVVIAKKVGTATITAKAGDKSATCAISVVATPVTSVTLDKTSASLKAGETVTLTATVKPDDATDKTVTWSTSDESVATVENGVVIAKKVGTATITAKAGDKSATCAISVVATPVTSVTLDKTSASLKAGETVTLTATVKPDDATDKTVTWSTSDASVATVDNGVVIAKKVGTATITAKAGDKSATCAISVVATPVTSVTLDKTSASLKAGETVTLTATVKPDDATDKTVTWSTSDESVATVENGVVIAKKVGTATITAKAGDMSATCAISVVATPVTSVTLDKTSASLKAGETVTLTATVKPDDATDKTVTWSTSDASVATVDNGVVIAKKVGTATITAKAGDKSATCAITVVPTPVSSISLNITSTSMQVGGTVTLTATVNPSDATDKTVTWSTSDASVATVDNGVVIAKKVGTATITAKAGDKSATCAVSVVPPPTIPVTSVTLDRASASLKARETVTLTATVKPDDASDKTVTWSTSDGSVATVTNGVVTAVAVGTATITAKAGEKSATCAITVVATPVTSVTLNKTSASIKAGETVTLTATVKPDDATDKTVTWRTSDASVATVENGVVTGKKVGTATITAESGGKSATCTITVVATPVTSVTLNKTSLNLTKNQSELLTATVGPADATDKTVTWSSSDVTIASVTKYGYVTALKSGNVTITAKAGDKSATCSVTITTPVESVVITQKSVTMEEEETTTLYAVVTPDDADDPNVSWSSSNTALATVENGFVTAVAAGTVTITAAAGGKSDTCQIIIEKKRVPVTSITLNKTSITLKPGESETLLATVLPENATDKTVTWSGGGSLFTVDSNGTVTANNSGIVGSSSVYARAGNVTAYCMVTVVSGIVEVTGVTMNKSQMEMFVGDSETLSATVFPEDATDKTITWTSEKEDVVSVDNNGKVTAVGPGSANIYAQAGLFYDRCYVSVYEVVHPVTSVTLNKTSLTLLVGDSETLIATVGPEDADNKTVTWTSSDPKIALVDSTGKVTAVKDGQVTITARAGTISAKCQVTVKVKGLDKDDPEDFDFGGEEDW